MKKIISIALVAMIMLSMIPMVFAASLNENETKILNELKSGAKIAGKSVYLPDEYIKQAENYMLKEDITEVEANNIVAEISEAKSIISTLDASVINSNGTISISKVPSDVKSKLVAIATNISNEIDLNFSINGTTISITDKDGATVFSGEVIIKNTGILNYVPAVSVAIVLLLIFGATIVIRKKSRA